MKFKINSCFFRLLGVGLGQGYTTFSLLEATLPIYFNLQPPINQIKNFTVQVKVNTFSLLD